jgi:hypothetical protein
MQLTARLVGLLAVTAAVGFGAAFMVARSGAEDDAGATTAARKTLPSVAVTGLDQTVRGVGAAPALPDLRRRPRTKTQTTTTTTQPPITTTTAPPVTTTTQPPITTQASPTTTQSAPPVTTQSG